MNLSKAFNTLNYDSLIAKLGAHGYEIKSYLINRKQKVRVD